VTSKVSLIVLADAEWHQHVRTAAAAAIVCPKKRK
jgi:hypothetical protein